MNVRCPRLHQRGDVVLHNERAHAIANASLMTSYAADAGFEHYRFLGSSGGLFEPQTPLMEGENAAIGVVHFGADFGGDQLRGRIMTEVIADRTTVTGGDVSLALGYLF